MCPRASAESVEIVTAFEGGYQFAATEPVGQVAKRAGDPGKVRLVQHEPGEGIGGMGIEPGRDEDQLGREILDPGQHMIRHRGAEGPPVRPVGQRHVHHVVVGARLVRGPGAGIERPLVGRAEQDSCVILDQVLGAVAVVNVEIDDRHAGQAMVIQRVPRRDGDRPEQAEAHGDLALGMVTGRAHRGKGVADLPGQDHVDPAQRRPDRPVCRGERAGREMRIGIQRAPATLGNGIADRIEVAAGMQAQYVVIGGHGGHNPDKVEPLERPEDGIEPGHLFGMSRRCHVAEAIRMCNQGGGHAGRERETLDSHKEHSMRIRSYLIAMLLIPLAAGAGPVGDLVTSDLNGDGVEESFRLIDSGSGTVDLRIAETGGDPVFAQDIAWMGGVGQMPELTVAEDGTIKLRSMNESVGRDRWELTLSIAWHEMQYRVIGVTYAWRDTLETEAEGTCDFNLVSGQGLIERSDSGALGASAPLTALPVTEWKDTTFVPPPACQ